MQTRRKRRGERELVVVVELGNLGSDLANLPPLETKDGGVLQHLAILLLKLPQLPDVLENGDQHQLEGSHCPLTHSHDPALES